MSLKRLVTAYMNGNLVWQIITGLVLGIVLAAAGLALGTQEGKPVALVGHIFALAALLGDFFVGALKSVAPILVLVLVASAIAQHKSGHQVHIKPILILYLFGTFTAALVAVLASFAFPTSLTLVTAQITQTPPSGIAEVLKMLVLRLVDNPFNAIATANYIGILAWAVLLGIALRHATEPAKMVLNELAEAITKIVRWVIRLAPIGVFGIVASTIAATGFSELLAYARLLVVLVGTMLFMAFVVNPLIVFVKIRKNPYPLVLACLAESGLTAFFTRSSAANIPVNMALAKKLGLHENTYSVSIPLGSTINMGGAAITITVLTLAAVHTLGIAVDIPTALLLSLLAAIAACGASGVPGGSLLLIPMACSLFGISNDLATQVVAVGFIIGVVQDSCETALNSSTDVLFTAAADLGERRRSGLS